MTLRVGICDDDVSYIEDFKKLILQYTVHTDIEITIQSFFNGGHLLDVCQTDSTFDILFLDIEMPEMGGLTLAEKIKKTNRDVFIVFVSNYPQYMQDSFRIHPFYYLVKPLTYDMFSKVMEDIISNIYEEHKLITLLPIDDKEETINIKDIRFIEVVNGKKELLCFHFFDHSCFCRGKLSTWTSKLKEYDFFQCHRAFLVNMAHIHYFTPKNATMDNGERVPLSRQKEKALKELYSKNVVKLKKL
jgi:DNA-binding LytR/AlgR family response regulator